MGILQVLTGVTERRTYQNRRAIQVSKDQLRKMHQARSFQPFDIHIADGRSLPVEHPEVLAIAPPGRTIGVGLSDENPGRT